MHLLSISLSCFRISKKFLKSLLIILYFFLDPFLIQHLTRSLIQLLHLLINHLLSLKRSNSKIKIYSSTRFIEIIDCFIKFGISLYLMTFDTPSTHELSTFIDDIKSPQPREDLVIMSIRGVLNTTILLYFQTAEFIIDSLRNDLVLMEVYTVT